MNKRASLSNYCIPFICISWSVMQKNNKNLISIICFVLCALITFSTAFAHLSCLYFGPTCYSAQMAPPIIVESAKTGTLIAPLGNLIVSGIFISWGLLALSVSGLFRDIPYARHVCALIAFLCVIRGLLPIQLWLRKPENIDAISVIVGFVWLLTGLLYAVGLLLNKHSQK